MYTYTIVQEIEGVPELADLGGASESQLASRGAAGTLCFPSGVSDFSELVQYERAVGCGCRVIRTADDGHRQERDGAVLRASPFVHVSLDGGDWH
jgi:hypothetical protein